MTNLLTTLFIFLGLNSMGQSDEKLSYLFDKKWIIKSYEVAGQSSHATDVEKDEYTEFYADHSVKTVNRGVTTLSKWKYDVTKNILTLYSESVQVTTEMKIFKLAKTEFVWETTNPEGMTMTIQMFNSSEK